ncbi:MAG: hypothetical protein LC624_04175 [Halobacteriales archaeon]|nr:hypothetical protein [Halobacteriales archaeon]
MQRVAVVQLTTGEVRTEPVRDAWRRSLLGGRGVNALLLAKFLPPRVAPLSDANVLVLGAGLLTGTAAPSSDRLHVTFKSPESGILGDGSIGGGFGGAMRRAGFDHVVVLGRADHPCWLAIEDGRIEVRDARSWSGLDPVAVERRLPGYDVLSTGPAGERLVRFASVRSGAGRSARCGGGAVMGSKLLKAIAARGQGEVPVARPEGLAAASREVERRIAASQAGRVLQEHGTAVYYDTARAMGVLRTKNGQRSTWGPIAPWPGERMEFSTLGLLGPNLGISDGAAIARLARTCNELGLDTSSAGTCLAWAFELAERGLIDAKLTGEPLDWGDAELCERLLRSCAAREGFGNVLAEGSQAVRLGYFPPEAARFFLGVKGMPQSDATDVRFAKGFALGLAVASRGADHLRNRPGFEWFLGMTRAAKEEQFGAATHDPAAYDGKAQAVVASEDLYAVIDSLGVSKLLASGLNAPSLLGFPELARLAAPVLGEDLDLPAAGARIANVERWLNLREGLTRADDTLPARCFDEALPDGLAHGARIDRARFEGMLDDYYAVRGWTKDGAMPAARDDELGALLQ